MTFQLSKSLFKPAAFDLTAPRERMRRTLKVTNNRFRDSKWLRNRTSHHRLPSKQTMIVSVLARAVSMFEG